MCVTFYAAFCLSLCRRRWLRWGNFELEEMCMQHSKLCACSTNTERKVTARRTSATTSNTFRQQLAFSLSPSSDLIKSSWKVFLDSRECFSGGEWNWKFCGKVDKHFDLTFRFLSTTRLDSKREFKVFYGVLGQSFMDVRMIENSRRLFRIVGSHFGLFYDEKGKF